MFNIDYIQLPLLQLTMWYVEGEGVVGPLRMVGVNGFYHRLLSVGHMTLSVHQYHSAGPMGGD